MICWFKTRSGKTFSRIHSNPVDRNRFSAIQKKAVYNTMKEITIKIEIKITDLDPLQDGDRTLQISTTTVF